jgi:hypothetical protein
MSLDDGLSPPDGGARTGGSRRHEGVEDHVAVLIPGSAAEE